MADFLRMHLVQKTSEGGPQTRQVDLSLLLYSIEYQRGTCTWQKNCTGAMEESTWQTLCDPAALVIRTRAGHPFASLQILQCVEAMRSTRSLETAPPAMTLNMQGEYEGVISLSLPPLHLRHLRHLPHPPTALGIGSDAYLRIPRIQPDRTRHRRGRAGHRRCANCQCRSTCTEWSCLPENNPSLAGGWATTKAPTQKIKS